MKLKLEEEYSHLKLWSLWHIMWVRLILLCILLILQVSILFCFNNRFVCYFRLLNFTLRKNRLNTVYTSDSILQERLPVGLEVGRIYFWSLDLFMWRCSLRKNQTNCKSSQDRYKIPLCWNNSFRDKQIICLRPAEYIRKNSLLIKVHV